MKRLTISFLAFFWVVSSYAQTINPKQYAVLPREGIANEKTAKRKDGTYSLSRFQAQEDVLFTPDGEYLYLLNTSEDWDGKLVIYNVKEAKIEKIFPMAKTGLWKANYFTYNNDNMYQIAIAVNKSEIIIIPDWRTEPENAFTKKASASTKRVVVNARTEFSKFGFSTDGKSLYMIENVSDPLKVVDIATGKAEKRILPKGKKLHVSEKSSPFIGNDEAFILSERNEKMKTRTADVYDIKSDKIVRSYEIEQHYSDPETYPYRPYLLYPRFAGAIFDLRSGAVDVKSASIKNAYASEKNNMADVMLIPGKGYMVSYTYYKNVVSENLYTKTESRETKHALIFLDNNGKTVKTSFPGVDVEMPWTGIGYFQISPNGKYVLFQHEDIKDDTKSKWIIATL